MRLQRFAPTFLSILTITITSLVFIQTSVAQRNSGEGPLIRNESAQSDHTKKIDTPTISADVYQRSLKS